MQKVLKRISKDKCILLILLLLFSSLVINCLAYFVHSSYLNRTCLFIEGLASLVILYKLIWYAAQKSEIKLIKSDFIIMGGMILASFAIYFSLVSIRNSIYVWDNVTYFKLMNYLLETFDQSNISGNLELLYSGMNYDYGSFMLIFIYPFFCFTNSTIQSFIFSYFFAVVVPVMLSLYIFAHFVYYRYFAKLTNNVLFKVTVAICLVCFPLLHTASICGQPDVFGLVFCVIIMLLTLSYDFSYRDYLRWGVLFLVTVALALTRRWYIFFIVSYYVSYFLILLLSGVMNKKFAFLKKQFINVFIFGILSGLVGFAVLYKMIFTVSGNNYSASYVSWKRGGLPYEFINQLEFLGVLVAAAVVIGLIYGIVNRNFRSMTLTMIISYFISIVMFTSIQNLGYHHSIILLPTYWLGFTMFIVLCFKARKNIIKLVPAVLMCISMINCTCFDVSGNAGDLLFSKLDIYPHQRSDLNQIKKVIDYLNAHVNEDGTAMILAGSDLYDGSVFANYPEVGANKYIRSGNFYASSGGFPDSFFTSDYVVLVTPTEEREQVKKEGVLSGIIDEFTNYDLISNKFKEVYKVRLNPKSTAIIYERIKPVDNSEVDVFLKKFEDYCDKYEEIFKNRLLQYKT